MIAINCCTVDLDSADDILDESSNSENENEWVPSSWDHLAKPIRSAMKSPDKSSSVSKIHNPFCFSYRFHCDQKLNLTGLVSNLKRYTLISEYSENNSPPLCTECCKQISRKYFHNLLYKSLKTFTNECTLFAFKKIYEINQEEEASPVSSFSKHLLELNVRISS